MGREHILLFGLSANPPTGEHGHLGLVRWAARRKWVTRHGEINGIWVVPVFRHAFTSKSDLASFEHRVAMCRLCFQSRRGDQARPAVSIDVSTAERELALANPDAALGSIDLIEYLETQHPQKRFSLLLGADTARDLWSGLWKDGDKLLKKVGLIVVPRVGVELEPQYTRWVASDAPALGAVSSTEARRSSGSTLRTLVAPEVATYIEQHKLYAPKAT